MVSMFPNQKRRQYAMATNEIDDTASKQHSIEPIVMAHVEKYCYHSYYNEIVTQVRAVNATDI